MAFQISDLFKKNVSSFVETLKKYKELMEVNMWATK